MNASVQQDFTAEFLQSNRGTTTRMRSRATLLRTQSMFQLGTGDVPDTASDASYRRSAPLLFMWQR